MDKVTKVISFLIALISVAGLAMCFDAIIVHCTEGLFLENVILKYLTSIGRIAGGFICGKMLFPIIYKYFSGDDTK